jgi:hypothetical protein
MRGLVIVAALLMGSSIASGQECIRPAWGKCVSFPNGGSHTGTSPKKEKITAEVAPGADICVSEEEELGGETFAHFARGGAPWPNEDWLANVEDFCFFKK